MLTTRIFLACALCALAGYAAATDTRHAPWQPRCAGTRSFFDGDTLTCVSETHGPFVVRFAGIDAPERGQAYWRAARDRLRELAVPGTVAECYKQDQYGRQVCRLRSADGKDLADTMIGEGLAWHAVRYAGEETPNERERYERLEAEAKARKRGLWAEPDPMPPWDCRQLRKKHQVCR